VDNTKTPIDGKLVAMLSMFGLAMGIATVFVIPSNVEPFCWLAIFLVCAFLIARRQPSRAFVHGLLTSLLNSVWITGAHLIFFDSYVAHHAGEAAMMANSPMPPKLMMLLTGPVVGLVSGLVLGLFSFVASKIVSPAKA
jgi:hypothetical protein